MSLGFKASFKDIESKLRTASPSFENRKSLKLNEARSFRELDLEIKKELSKSEDSSKMIEDARGSKEQERTIKPVSYLSNIENTDLLIASNLSSEEIEPSLEKVYSSYTLKPQQMKQAWDNYSNENGVENSVKNQISQKEDSSSVKTMTDESITEAPLKPQILSIERVELAKEGGVPLDKFSKFFPLISSVAKRYGIDPSLSLAVAKAESSFDHSAISSDGHSSKGLYQLLDSTGLEVAKKLGVDEDNYDPFDPVQNTEFGNQYLSDLVNQFSDLIPKTNTNPLEDSSSNHQENFALAAYNAGKSRVLRAQDRARELGRDPTRYESIEEFLPSSTQNYVEKVQKYRGDFLRQLEQNNLIVADG